MYMVVFFLRPHAGTVVDPKDVSIGANSPATLAEHATCVASDPTWAASAASQAVYAMRVASVSTRATVFLGRPRQLQQLLRATEVIWRARLGSGGGREGGGKTALARMR